MKNLAGWHVDNQRSLAAEVSVLRQRIDQFAGRPVTAALPGPRRKVHTALDRLSTAFALSAFERAVVLMCAAVELDAGFAESCAAAQGAGAASRPTIGLALSALPEGRWSDLAPCGKLRESLLVTTGAAAELVRAPLSIDEPLLHYLLDGALLDPEILALAVPVDAPARTSQHFVGFVAQALAAWDIPDDDVSPPVLRLTGAGRSGGLELAGLIAQRTDIVAYRFDAALLPQAPSPLVTLVRRWQRLHRLHGAIAVFDLDNATAEAQAAAERFVDMIDGPSVIIGGNAPSQWLRRPVLAIEIDRQSAEHQTTLWREALTAVLPKPPAPSAIAQLVSHFNTSSDAIRGAALAAAAAAKTRGDWEEAVWEACRARARPKLGELAQCVRPRADWGRLVLPPEVARQLRELVAQVQLRYRVYGEWGMGAAGSRGLATTALFAGPSGTGKTLAGEIIAGELRLDLYRIDLSAVVSKYIGETEKNLAKLFDAAEGSGAVLLFDEADALFGKRSEVRDSHDRYANIEVSYLLQRMETYSGLAILTTNLRDALDTAFLRRLRFIVDFPFPDAAARARLWEVWLPPSVPRHDIEPATLSHLVLSGGQIYNVAINAAFLAAAENDGIGPSHILTAVRREYAKSGRTLSETEISALRQGRRA